MANQPAKYTDEFRRETADYIISTGRPITECCAELGLNSKTVNKWVQNRRRELSGEPDPKAEDRELREARSVSVNIFFTIFTNVFSPIAPTRMRRIRQRGCAAFGV